MQKEIKMSQIVLNGNNIDLLKKYPDNYFDAVVTDPPYGLGKEPNAEEVMKGWVEKGYHEVGGSGFMGKEWDAFIPQPIFWKEVFRVLKHGGHIVSFFGTRTYDWGVMSMRFAGFEVRDCIQWVFGSGFPKSHNIGKAIDKIYGAEREVVGKATSGSTAKAFNLNEQQREAGTGIIAGQYFLTKGNSEWEGFGSALKPANEPIVLARKPLEKGLSIAENVLKWGTGGINIDGCRVKTDEKIENHSRGLDSSISKGKYGNSKEQDTHQTQGQKQGRFPSNLILTHHPECECKGLKKIKAIKGGNGIATMNSGMGKNGIYGTYSHEKLGENAGGLGDENGEETIEHWECVNGGELISPCIYLDGIEINKFNFHHYLNVIQLHRANSHILATPYIHNKDKYNFLDCETFHDLGWKQLPSFRVYYQFLSHFYDALVQTFQVYDQLSVQQLNDALYIVHHLLELLHNHLCQNHDLLSKQNDSALYSLSQHIYLNKSFYFVFLNKISYCNTDILFQELEKNDIRDNILGNKIFEDFLFYLTKIGLNNSSILHLHQMLFCLSLEINFSNQIYYKKFELPHCPIKIMDEQSGVLKSGAMDSITKGGQFNVYGQMSERRVVSLPSEGGASRFFYCAKASKSERNNGLEGFEERENKHSTYGIHSDEGLLHNGRNPENRSRTMSNFHPTVKPVKLMQYLARLITPPNGKVLDPFCGSGTTGIACKLEGFEFVGMEQDAEYTKIAQARIDNYQEEPLEPLELIQEDSNGNTITQTSLF